MDKGHIFIKNYIKRLEECAKSNNPDIKGLVLQDGKIVQDLITLLYQVKDWQAYAKRKYDVMVTYICESRNI